MSKLPTEINGAMNPKKSSLLYTWRDHFPFKFRLLK